MPTSKADEVEKKAKALYNHYINNHPSIHTNRFPTWDEMNKDAKEFWLTKAKR